MSAGRADSAEKYLRASLALEEENSPAWGRLGLLYIRQGKPGASDAAYDQAFYSPLRMDIIKRYAWQSEEVRRRVGNPQRVAYGPSEPEKLDIYRTKAANAPILAQNTGLCI